MAISDRITSIEEHIKESYQELEGIGIDTTGINKNLENIPKLIDGYWETLPKVTGEGTSITLDNTKEGKMKIVLKGNTSQEGTPTPETPQDIHVVSGDNSIDIVGKNLFNGETELGTFNNSTGEKTTSTNTRRSVNKILVKPSTQYIFSQDGVSFAIRVYYYQKNGTYISTEANSNGIFTTPSNAYYVNFISDRIVSNYNDIQLEQGNQATTYEAYKGASYPINLGDIELCKIGDYQDSIKKSTGKNLIDINTNVLNDCYIATANMKLTTASGATCYWFEAKDNTTYTMSRDKGDRLIIGGYNSIPQLNDSGTLIYDGGTSTATTYTFTNTNYKYIVLYLSRIATTTPNWVMLNEGSTALPYEPYGTGWYLNKQIGKVVLDGTQNITQAPDGIRRFNARYTTLGLDNIKDGNGTYDSANYRLCDHFIHSNEDYHNQVWGVYYTYNGWLVLYDTNSVIADATALANWFSNNNTSIYYVLATPTYTKIEGTLESQLNALAKSYASQTNISQDNNDLASILNATALEEM